jgi:hypothetical protein
VVRHGSPGAVIGRNGLQHSDRPRPLPHAAVIGIGCLVAVAVVAVVQALHLSELMDTGQPLNAGHAIGLVGAYALASITLVAATAVLPGRLLWVPVAGSASVAVTALGATLLVGGEVWSFTAALLTMAACWQLGRWLLTAAGTPGLAALPPVAWLAGVGAVGLTLLVIGRAGIVSWWTVGAPVVLVGVWGIGDAARVVGPAGGRAAWSAVTSTRLAAAAAALSLLATALAAIWVAAPELMYDALLYKAWLPSEWARTGEIEPLVLHPYFNVAGFGQLIAIPGHTVGADGVGRYLQWVAQGGLVATVWWAARRSAWAPLAAATLALVPLLFWEQTTAYDDTILTLAGVALALAVLSALESPEGSPAAVGAALGALAGVCFDLKMHLAPLAGGLVLGWLLLRGRSGWKPAAGATVAGALMVAAPPLVLRWIDTGNPVLPFLNNVFRSPHWPATDNLGFLDPARLAWLGLAVALLSAWLLLRGRPGWRPVLRVLGAVGVAVVILISAWSWIDSGSPPRPIGGFWESIADPGRHVSWAPVGTLGLLSVAVPIALLIGWRQWGRGPGVPALWLGVVVGAALWYTQFRDPRYLLPTGALAVLVIALSSPQSRPRRRLEAVGLAGLALVAVLLWPSTVAQYWNVPGRGIPWKAAIGLIEDREYERQATSARDLVAAFDRLSPPGALAAGDTSQRLWLTEGRDFTPFWELEVRLRVGRHDPVDPAETDPAETFAAVRAAGVSWVVVSPGDGLPRRPYLRRMVEQFGVPVWSSAAGTLYELPSAPRGPSRAG